MRILLLSYHFPPLAVTASQRAGAWAKYLPNHDIDLTVVTFDWPGEKSDEGLAKVIRLPTGRMPDHTHLPLPWRIPLVSKAATVLSYQSGNFDYHTTSQQRTMWRFLTDHLRHNSYDLVVGIYSPHFHLRHAAAIEQKFGIPFVIDFRDLFNNRAADRPEAPFAPTYLERMVLASWKRWMRKAAGFTSVSQPLTEVLSRWFKTPGATIINGYDPEGFPDVNPPRDCFITTYSGTLYTTQNLRVFLEGYADFARDKDDVLLTFRGVTSVMESRVRDELAKWAPNVRSTMLPRCTREENLRALRESHVLFYPGHEGMRGSYSSKIFEFIAAERPIIHAPADGDVIDELLAEFEGCTSTSTPAGVCEELNKGYVQYRSEPHPPLLRRYTEHLTRESQAAMMAAYLHRVYGEINQRNEA